MKTKYRNFVSVRVHMDVVKRYLLLTLYIVLGLLAFAAANIIVAYTIPIDEYYYEKREKK